MYALQRALRLDGGKKEAQRCSAGLAGDKAAQAVEVAIRRLRVHGVDASRDTRIRSGQQRVRPQLLYFSVV